MNTNTQDPGRNRPSDEGRKNDPHSREESAQQPGASTYSSSPTDDLNQDVTETTSDGFRTAPQDPRADPAFDDITDENNNI